MSNRVNSTRPNPSPLSRSVKTHPQVVVKTSKVGMSIGATPSNQDAKLAPRRVTVRTPLLVFITFIRRIWNYFFGKVEEPTEKPQEASSSFVSREAIEKSFYDKVQQDLKERLGEQKAERIFTSIFPSLKDGVQKELNQTLDIEKLRKPLIDLTRSLMRDYEINNQLEELAVKLMDGKLRLDRAAIFQTYPQLQKALEVMPDQKEKFETLLSRIWIEKELNNMSKYQGLDFEKSVLKALGYNIDAYDEKETLKRALSDSFQQSDLPPLEELPQIFKKRAFIIRAKAAGVSDKELPGLRQFLKFYMGETKKLHVKAQQIRESVAIESKNPLAAGIVRNRFHAENMRVVRQHLAGFLNKNQKTIRQKLSSPKFGDFLTSFNVSKGLKLSTALKGSAKEADLWFKKYERMVVSEFSQGENDVNEMLGEGVCLALAYRMAAITLQSPHDQPAKIAVKEILPQDRVIQAHHNTKGIDRTTFSSLPRKLLAQQKHKEQIVFAAKSEAKVRQALIDKLPTLTDSNGGIILGWKGHATFMRFDSKRNIFFFFDPNYNTIEFRKNNGETLEHLAGRMADAYIELYRWAYPKDDELMDGRQIVPMKAGEELTKDRFDLTKIPFYHN